MKKSVIFLCVLLLCLQVTVFVNAEQPYFIDDAQLLNDEEAAKLEDLLAAASEKLDIDIVVHTTDSLGGKTAMAYTDDYYDYHGYGDDGVILMVSMTERQWWISTAGRCIALIDSDLLGSQFAPLLSIGQYYNAFTSFLDGCEMAMEAENNPQMPDSWYPDTEIQDVYPSEPAKPQPMVPLGVCIVAGVVVGLIAVLVMKGQLKSVRSQSGAGNYIRTGSLRITQQSDMFLYQNTTRRAKPQNNNNSGSRSGGRSFHVGSSGRRHGGGGGRF